MGGTIRSAFPGLRAEPWDGLIRAPFLWHFALHALPGRPELLVTGRESAYFGYFYDLLSDIDAALAPLAVVGCVAVGEPRAVPDGARRGSRFAYVRDPDGVTLELIQIVAFQPQRPGGQP